MVEEKGRKAYSARAFYLPEGEEVEENEELEAAESSSEGLGEEDFMDESEEGGIPHGGAALLIG